MAGMSIMMGMETSIRTRDGK